MKFLIKKQLILATVAYWILLLYIIAALVWWFIALQQQNRAMTAHRLVELHAADPDYFEKVKAVRAEEQTKTAQYVGEGATFLILILVGAVFVYRAVRNQFRVSQEQQNFMMAVTHELKTPLAVIRLNLETLQKHRLDEQKQSKLLHMTLEETERLTSLANNILISSQLEGGGYKLAREELDLSALAADAVHHFRNRFPDHDWHAEVEPEIEIRGDTLLLQIMINNLLENAVKYSPKYGPISFSLSRQPGLVQLKVSDQGIGIPLEEKKKVFQRFYRVGSEAVRATKGTGLGLYLCRKIAADHRAMISVRDNHPAGSIFIVEFKTEQ